MPALDESTISYGVKCLALCTAKNKEAGTYIADNNLVAFHSLLSSSNETIVGNSALILSTCFEQGMRIGSYTALTNTACISISLIIHR